MNEEFSKDYKVFNNDSWRIERRLWVDREGKEHETDSVVAPRYHLRLDKGMSYRYAKPKEMKGEFKIGIENGYCIWISDSKGRSVCSVTLKNSMREREDDLELEESIWLAEKITELLNNRNRLQEE